jgi:hypothetical protein
LLRPVVLAHQLPKVDKRPSGGLRTTVEVVGANRALVSSRNAVSPTIFLFPLISFRRSRRWSRSQPLLDNAREREEGIHQKNDDFGKGKLAEFSREMTPKLEKVPFDCQAFPQGRTELAGPDSTASWKTAATTT